MKKHRETKGNTRHGKCCYIYIHSLLCLVCWVWGWVYCLEVKSDAQKRKTFFESRHALPGPPSQRSKANLAQSCVGRKRYWPKEVTSILVPASSPRATPRLILTWESRFVNWCLEDLWRDQGVLKGVLGVSGCSDL